jgi:lipoate-protein ligase A
MKHEPCVTRNFATAAVAKDQASEARLLIDGPLAGATNMARDESLLETRALPTLRFYRWAKPTLSLGYFQHAADLPLDAVRARGGEVVRRSTGGKAILHEHELTYSLCAPEVGALAGGPAAAMSAIHEAWASELARQAGAEVRLRHEGPMHSDIMGSAWCFEDSSPLDLAMEGRKLLGSAARRRHGWILFHGSLVLEHPQETPGIAALGREPDVAALTSVMAKALGYDFQVGAWSPEELAKADAIEAKRFGSDAFTLLR